MTTEAITSSSEATDAVTEAAAVAVPTPLTTTGPVAMVPSMFHFKTEKLRDEKGNVIGDGKKHPSVAIALPVPSVVRLQEYLADPVKFPKEVELLLSTVLDQIYRVARGQINDWRETNKDGTVTAASLNFDKLDWTAIANMPKGERASTVPADEDIKAFLAHYLQVMPDALQKPKKNIENHVACFDTGFKKQRSQKDILEAFVVFLSTYVTVAGEDAVQEHQEVIEYFSSRLEKLLKTEEKITMDSL
jgi:hypothetical protein